MYTPLNKASVEDIPYADYEVSRDSGALNGDFMDLDGGGPLLLAIGIAREEGRLAVLDAGCGTGYGLADFKDQVNFRAPLEEDKIEATGISLSDVRSQFDGGWREKARLSNGYIALTIGNLATIELQPDHYDVAFSYEVLLHNSDISAVLNNVSKSIRAGGTYYFNTLVEQQTELEAFFDSLKPSSWDVLSKPLERRFIGGSATRVVTKLVKKIVTPDVLIATEF